MQFAYGERLELYQKDGIPKVPNDVYLEVVGGCKNGRVYGLGSASDLFYGASSSSKAKGSSACTPSVLSQLSSKIEECQRMAEESLKLAETTQQKYEREKDEWMKERDEYRGALLEMQNNFKEFSQLFHDTCGTSFTPSQFHNRHDPPDPLAGGAHCVA